MAEKSSDAYRKDSSPKVLNWERGAPPKGSSPGKSKDAPKVGKIKDASFGFCKPKFSVP
jgi:hypothetical protein